MSFAPLVQEMWVVTKYEYLARRCLDHALMALPWKRDARTMAMWAVGARGPVEIDTRKLPMSTRIPRCFPNMSARSPKFEGDRMPRRKLEQERYTI